MSRIKISLPAHFSFTCRIPVRITDMNYGGHAGNDTILSLIHEARVQFFHHLGYTELNLAGAGLIMADAGIEFKNEIFYGETVIASVTAADISRFGFDLYYKLEKTDGVKTELAALAKTGMVCFDYKAKKIMSLPEEAALKLSGQ